MVTHSSILAWRIPRTEEPGRLQSMGLQRVAKDLPTVPTRLTPQFMDSPCYNHKKWIQNKAKAGSVSKARAWGPNITGPKNAI